MERAIRIGNIAGALASDEEPSRSWALASCRPSTHPAPPITSLIASVTCFRLMSNGENQNDIFVW